MGKKAWQSVGSAASSTDNHGECPAHKSLLHSLRYDGNVRVIASLFYGFCVMGKKAWQSAKN